MAEEYSPLENLFKEYEERTRVVDEIKAPKKPHTQANKSADLDDFIEMVGHMVAKTMKDLKVEYIPDDHNQRIKDQGEKIENPYITHKVVLRETTKEIKPRIREEFAENGHDPSDNRQGQITGQRFACEVQFNIFASEYKMAQDVMRRFEDNMLRYSYFFMKNGVQQILFKKQFDDVNYKIFRENISVRNLLYQITIEHLTVGFNTELEDISIQ